MTRRTLITAAVFSFVSAFRAVCRPPSKAPYPPPIQGDFVVKGFHFRSGETMDVKMHYRDDRHAAKERTGRDDNAVLVMHGTGGTGAQLVVGEFRRRVVGRGQLLDVTKYFFVCPDDIGHGAIERSRATACTRSSRSTATST